MFFTEAIASMVLAIGIIAYFEFIYYRNQDITVESKPISPLTILILMLAGVLIFFLCLVGTYQIKGLTQTGFTLTGWILCTVGGISFVFSQYWSLRRLFYDLMRKKHKIIPDENELNPHITVNECLAEAEGKDLLNKNSTDTH